MAGDDTKNLNPDKQENTGRLEDGTFAPGVSGNPAGRPKRKTLTELIHAKLDDTPEAWEAIVSLVVQKLIKDKDNQILKTFWEYTDGKPKQTIELNDTTEQIRQTKEYVDNKIQSMDGDISQEPARGEVRDDSGSDGDI